MAFISHMRPLRTEHTENNLGGDAAGTQREAMCPLGPHESQSVVAAERACDSFQAEAGASGQGAAPVSL